MLLRVLTALTLAVLPLSAQEFNPKPANPGPAEAAFIAMLKNATLNGTWAPIDKRLLGDDQGDEYFIVSARPMKGDQWIITSRMNFQGQEVDFPIPVTIKFAGDAAVMILDNVPIGPGQTWSARILFHDDVYAGSWWGKDKSKKSGIVSGTITREE